MTPGDRGIAIRSAGEADLPLLVALDEIAGREPGRVRLIERLIQANACLVAVRDDRCCGYTGIEYSFFDCGFIPIVYVEASLRRQGIGRALVEAISGHCRTPKLFTSTNESNAPMRALLEDLQFEPSGVIHNLDPGDPELVYFRQLRP